jgi:hypothetical protein
MRKFKAIMVKVSTSRTVNITQIHGSDTNTIRKMTRINHIGIRLKGALFADARTAGQLGILRRNAIRPRRDIGYNLIGN